MKLTLCLSSLLGSSIAKSVATLPPVPQQIQHVLANPTYGNESFHFPTVRESVAMARKAMHLTTIGDLITVFPEPSGNSVDAEEQRPSEMGGSPIGLMEYYADCDPLSGNPVLLAINIATPYRNHRQGSNISLSIKWWPKQETSYSLWSYDGEDIPTPHTPAALPRFSLHGYLEPISQERLADGKIADCFMRSHPDSRWWQPGSRVHESQYVQLVVEHVYWLGGFGDRARIQWLPMEEWRNLTMKEVIDAKLPGERSTKSWWKQWL